MQEIVSTCGRIDKIHISLLLDREEIVQLVNVHKMRRETLASSQDIYNKFSS